MAEVIKVRFWHEINVSNSVGEGGVNNKDDVLVVQALLKYAAASRNDLSKMRFSKPTGKMDRRTRRNIKKFQRYLRQKGKYPISVDGRIDPLRGGIRVPGKRLHWTIAHLNALALEAHLLQGRPGENYIQSICIMYPHVRNVLRDFPVGTLNLFLESSPIGIGTLDMGLE